MFKYLPTCISGIFGSWDAVNICVAFQKFGTVGPAWVQEAVRARAINRTPDFLPTSDTRAHLLMRVCSSGAWFHYLPLHSNYLFNKDNKQRPNKSAKQTEIIWCCTYLGISIFAGLMIAEEPNNREHGYLVTSNRNRIFNFLLLPVPA